MRQSKYPSFHWKTNGCIRRHPANPILAAKDIPFPAALVFNAGVCKYQGRYVMVYRADHGDAAAKTLDWTISLGLAFSDDGVRWKPQPKPLAFPFPNAYDPRLTVLDGRVFLCFAGGVWAGGTWRGTVGGVAVTDDFEKWEILNVTVPDNRNMVIFPERFGGKIVRLERPFAGYLRPGDPFDIYISASPDGRYWGDSRLLLHTGQVAWVNDKIGPGAPPVRTRRGWLVLFHGVDRDPSRRWGWEGDWNKRYSGGLMLLDLDNPYRVIGLCPQPVLVPEPQFEYEAKGYRDFVSFPGGMILEDSGEVKIYYGAADTVECLATAHVEDLLNLCEPL